MKIVNINGNMCLFSNKKYDKNEIIHKLTGYISKTPSKNSIEIKILYFQNYLIFTKKEALSYRLGKYYDLLAMA